MNDNKPHGGVGEGISYPCIQRVTVVLQNLAKVFNVLYETVHAQLVSCAYVSLSVELELLTEDECYSNPVWMYSKSLLPVARVL